jgi:hypothetical protein
MGRRSVGRSPAIVVGRSMAGRNELQGKSAGASSGSVPAWIDEKLAVTAGRAYGGGMPFRFSRARLGR